MANRLVPYTQDEEKWKQHYIQRAMRQVHPESNLKLAKIPNVCPNYILPNTQYLAQAKDDMKNGKNNDTSTQEVAAPIKATPEFTHPHSSSTPSTGQISTKKTPKRKSSTPDPHKKGKKRKKDILD